MNAADNDLKRKQKYYSRIRITAAVKKAHQHNNNNIMVSIEYLPLGIQKRR